MNKLIVAVVGFKGKMGSVVFEALKEQFLVVGIDKEDSLNLVNNADVVVDFSTPENSVNVAKWCAQNNKKLVIGTTGHNGEQLEEIRNCSKLVPVLISGNFSKGIKILKRVLIQILGNIEADVTILEKHHKQKLDSPSGTAIEIQNIIKKYCQTKPEVLSERGGKEIGTHKVDIYFGNEVISISHSAFSRKAFADGVIESVNFIIKKEQGLFSFDDAL